MGGHLELLKWAHANGCQRDEKELYVGAQNGHEAVVRTLIEAGADVNKATDDGWTPLSIAAGHTAILQILRDAVLVRMQHLSL